MISERLRKSILQAAIQGKLTEQLPEDGDARDLLAEIQAEKAQLIKDGKIEKEKSHPEITRDEIPFDIPENWCWLRIRDIISVSSGKGLTQKDMDLQGNYPVYGGNGINGSHSEWFVPKDTIVIGRVGFYCGCVHKAVSDCWVTDNALIVEVKKNVYDTDFLQLVLRELDLKSTSVSTAQPVISGMRIYPQIVPVPPKNEQRRILEKLDEVLPQINELQNEELKLNTLQKSFPKKMKDSLLQSAIQGKLTDQLESDGDARDLVAEIQKEKARLIKNKKIKKENDLLEIKEDEIPFDIPENWCWVHLGGVFEIARGGSPRPIQSFVTTKEDGINWIKISDTDIGGKYINQTKDKIIPQGVKKSRVVNSGDLLLTNSMSFGRPYILNTRGCIHDGWLVLSPLSDGINREYFYYLLSTEFIRMAFAGTVAGAVVKNLNSDKVRVVTVPLPPASEQQRIVEKLDRLLPLCNALE